MSLKRGKTFNNVYYLINTPKQRTLTIKLNLYQWGKHAGMNWLIKKHNSMNELEHNELEHNKTHNSVHESESIKTTQQYVRIWLLPQCPNCYQHRREKCSPSSSLVHQHQEEVSGHSLQVRLQSGVARPPFIDAVWSLERLEECGMRYEARCGGHVCRGCWVGAVGW